jgi:hypothetical protein
MATHGKARPVTVPHDATSDISRHWIAINLFLETTIHRLPPVRDAP